MADLNLTTIQGHRTVEEVNNDHIFLRGKIDDNCKVTLVSRTGDIEITGKIDNNCNVTLVAAGDVRIGTRGSPGDRKIDNNCTVMVDAGGSISVGNKIDNHCDVTLNGGDGVAIGNKIDDNCNVVIEAGGAVTIGDKIDNNSSLSLRAVDDVTIRGVINNNCTATIDTLHGGITIREKIDDNSNVRLSAAGDIRIGISGGSGDRHINNRCIVSATSGGQIRVGDKLGDDCVIQFRACGNITIGSVVERGCDASFETREGNLITVRRIRDNNTSVTYWGGDLIEDDPNRHQTPTVRKLKWADGPLFCAGPTVTGEWWQNWGWKYGYVAHEKRLPESLEELVSYIASLDASRRTKAVGGAWSFTDASLPMDTIEAVDNVSIEKRGIGGTHPVRRLLEGAPDSYRIFPFDGHPNTVVRSLEVSGEWSQSLLRKQVESGFHLPGAPGNTSIIDTRRLCSTLQPGFSALASEHAQEQIASGRHFFHVEAGITVSNLNILLDHQKPRLAIQASGGSPGATLAGTLSTATHGGEFAWPLLIDRVKAIHFVGPGGKEWWIEGDESIADLDSLSAVYPNIDADHFIAGNWTHDECLESYTAEDVLRSVTVSMGVMGVIYSVVLEVVPAYGIRQKVKRIDDWSQVLRDAGVTKSQLRSRDEAANRQLLDYILDGTRNGTGIPRAANKYVDLALNPINNACWVINRQVTRELPRASKDLDLSISQYEAAFRKELTNHEAGIFGAIDDEALARVMDFLNYGRSVSDVANDFQQAERLVAFLLDRSPLLASALATVNGQLVLNEQFRSERGRQREFVGDVLTAVLNVLMGTVVEDVSDITDLSYKVGAIGWTDEGLPGKGFEIALPPELGFSFLQSAILDEMASSPPLIGYISIRVCPHTNTLMGMQQFEEYSVMIEPVGFRTPASLKLFQEILDRLASWNTRYRAGGMLHWGLENDTLDRERFENSAVTRPYKSGSSVSKLVVFKAVKALLQGTHPAVFDNHFVKRLGLDDYVCELREVTATRKRMDNIEGLCYTGSGTGYVSEAQAVRDIRSRGIRYFVAQGGERVFVHVVNGRTGPYLRTAPDDSEGNNLLSLPDC